MMGRQWLDQAQFFYSFHLDERVPTSHLLCKIDVLSAMHWQLFIARWRRSTAIPVAHRLIPSR